jgi:hypothetical protein
MAIEVGDTCKKGHLIVGDNIQVYTNQGRERVRCSTCNQPPRSNPKKKPGDLCKNGHVIIGDNLREKKMPTGIAYICVICSREAVRRQNSKYMTEEEMERRDKGQNKSALQSARRAAEKADQMIGAGKEDNALNYLKLNKRSERMSDVLQKAMTQNKAKCADKPEVWVDYEEGEEPTKNQAYVMCHDCPVLVECARFASAYRPAVGVWGGEVYKDGKLLHK